ncbi:hypothetical protein K431DRAFT_232190 [Polychaeton citri CBS 116435]|uniref:F-box domain-containing protein n=1 Tax=Polychaeton citri CBS 116435 TaxID=1314669 RepID=A0A9P4Q4A6_9PEZI|nr:hypothetical protein K431DRAFT_232190 [Polychaeton citri CBS 116435]
MIATAREKKRPLHLLDLPVDILKDIVKEVTHTNDLTSLALCHSALHSLAIPHIYSRFDIVWPDSSTHAEPRSGVDALTYGLATLVMAEEIFGEAPWQRKKRAVLDKEDSITRDGARRATERQVRRRRGNYYAQYTRKFSLGNGPADWVSEYSIGKEGGKMLGTLVALAVARMRSLETFIWDMPTGILRDVWLALSSLADREDGRSCRLEKFWMRWHDNSGVDAVVPVHPTSGALGAVLPSQIPPTALDRVEHPNFSVLPPLKSLSVLDIDELVYLDEMAVLIERSLGKLRELRLGIARHAIDRDWITIWDGESVQQIDRNDPSAASLTIGDKRLGGVLGILTGLIYDMKRPRSVSPSKRRRRSSAALGRNARAMAVPGQVMEPPAPLDPDTTSSVLSGITSLRDVLPDVPTNEPGQRTSWVTDHDSDPLVAMSGVGTPDNPTSLNASIKPQHLPAALNEQTGLLPEDEPCEPLLNGRLRLDSLELERVPLSITVMQHAVDWTRLTSLTLLNCHNHEHLWKTLKRSFAPVPKSPSYPNPRHSSTPRKSRPATDSEMVYPLSLKKIHVNTVSPALIGMIKETLAPNSLQTLILQETRGYNSAVTIEAIFKGAFRRHRNSLTRVLIDSSEKGVDGLPVGNSRWRRWMVTREILAFITSGKMPALKELGVTLDYRDWHFFLQNLPSIPQLRSLYVPFLADHPHGSNADAKELALQIVDIVALRPEVELCYMGIANKCFEILENRRGFQEAQADNVYYPPTAGGNVQDGVVTNHNNDEVDDDEGEIDEVDDVDGMDVDEEEEDLEHTESDDDDDDDDDDEVDDHDDADSDSETSSNEAYDTARLRLREILFYDDKVAIFKARHGRL